MTSQEHNPNEPVEKFMDKPLIDESLLKVIAQMYTAIRNNDTTTLSTLLKRDGQEFDLFDFRDAQGYTPLSLACFKNNEASFELIYEQCRHKNDFLKFINVQNIEGFSAIHFASFHGSYSMLRKLSDSGADIKQVNN